MREKFKMILSRQQTADSRRNRFALIWLIMLSFFILNSFASEAAIKEKKGKKEQVQRTATQNFDLQRNTVSNFQFPVTNYGILFLDVARNVGGGYWPRGSLNQYLFGGGIWLAAQKWIWTDTGTVDNPMPYRKLTKLCEVTYNPNSGSSWMVPGRIEDGDEIDNTDIYKYRNYFSTDFRTSDGAAINSADGPNWPIWDASSNDSDVIKIDRYYGYYIDSVENRRLGAHKKGPAFISGEDIFSTYKDTDLNYYEGGVEYRRNLGYPMRLQFEQYIYSWGFGDYKDFIFIRYEIINKSKDTLYNCWLAPVMDVDIARAPNTAYGAGNDKARFYDEDPSKNMAIQWTNDDRGEKGYGFGYLCFDFLESPAVHDCERTVDTLINNESVTVCYMCIEKDTVDGKEICVKEMAFDPGLVNYPRRDRRWYDNQYQLGLKTFRRWPINDDIPEDESRYNYMSGQVIEQGEGEPGDYRFMMATGSFNMLPGDTVRTVVGMILANSVLSDATGKTDDLVEAVRKDEFAQEVYDNNFRAPIPPDKSIIYRWDPLNHAVAIQWDSTSEITNDEYERGLDFMGFRLYRARRTDLDSFFVDDISPSIAYTSGLGPMGWKQIAQWEMPTPFRKSYNRAGTDPWDFSMPLIDSMEIVGPDYKRDTDGKYLRDTTGKLILDTFAIKVMRIAKGFMPFGPNTFVWKNMRGIAQNTVPSRIWNRDTTMNVVIYGIDTSLYYKPWADYYLSKSQSGDFPLYYDPYNPEDMRNRQFLLDSVVIGTIKLNSALLDYNPLYWRRMTVNVSVTDTADFPDTVSHITHIKYLKDTYRVVYLDGAPQLVMDQLKLYDTTNILKAMCDTVNVRKALDSIYSYIQRGLAKSEFPDFEGREDVRFDIITPFMKEITRGNRFTDIGDDNRSGEISFNLNPSKTEKLINNVPYYYKLLGYDEGDYNQPTPRKLNSASQGLTNFVTTYPREASIMEPPQFKIIYLDSLRIGGLYNFKFFGLDNDRVRQLFSGHTLEMEFNPIWMLSNFSIKKENSDQSVTVPYSLYRSLITMKDLSDDGRLLFRGETLLEQTSGQFYIRAGFTENAQSWVVDYEAIEDTVKDILIRTAELGFDTVLTRTSIITTGDFKSPGYNYTYGFAQPAYGTLGFSFNYTAQQRGGVYRPDSSAIFPPFGGRPSPIVRGDIRVPINFITDINSDINTTFDSSIVYRTQVTGIDIYGMKLYTKDTIGIQPTLRLLPEYGVNTYGSFNNGPAEYLIEFKAGGQETLNLKSEVLGTSKDFVCDYLLMDVKNVVSYKRPGLNGDSVLVTYPLPIEHMAIDTGLGYQYPYLGMLGQRSNEFIGKYNLSSYGWINGSQATAFVANQKYAVPGNLDPSRYKRGLRTSIGTQGRFYLNSRSTDGIDTIYFVNAFLASGVTFTFDLAKNFRLSGPSAQWKLDSNTLRMNLVMPKPGDQVLLKTNGGALGFPMPGAKIRVYIDSNVVPEGHFTDDLLDQIGVVPNPYYITHEGQSSPYDAKIYFTRLPKRATIDIYTITGDLVRTLEHDEFTSPEKDKVGAEVWDLLTKNRQRVQSQTFIAVIKTPDGAQTVKKFSVVVGGFRLVPEDE
ncbi:MAG: hypothetical protein V1779_12095 [bacterium]